MSDNLNGCPNGPEPKASPIANLIRTRPEAFDFGDAPDSAPLSDQYQVDMDARRPLWLREMIRKHYEDAD